MNEFQKKIAAAEDRLKAILASAEESGGFTDEQTAEVTQLEADIAKLEADAKVAEDLKKRMASRTAPLPRKTTNTASVITKVRDAVEDDPKCGFKHDREFLSAVMTAGMTGQVDDRLKPLRSMAAGSDEFGEYSQAYGGFTIPEGFRPDPLMLGFDSDPTDQFTTKIPMANPTVRLNARVDKNHSSSVSGGMRVYRRAETEDVTASRSAMEQVTLNAHTLMGVSYATEELLSDSPISFAAIIANGFRDELAATKLQEKLRGTGVGQYEGILGAPCLITVSKEVGQTADTILYANVVNMLARAYRPQMWMANHNAMPTLMNMADAFGRFIWQPSAREGAPPTLLGLPVYFSEFASSVGDVGDLILANWREYLEGELQGLQSAESVHVRFLNNERAFRVTMRNDGRCWWRSALTPKYGSTLSPFVVLEAR